MLFAAWCLLCVVRVCSLFAVWCFGVRWPLLAVCCVAFGGRCLSFVVWCLLCVVCCLMFDVVV